MATTKIDFTSIEILKLQDEAYREGKKALARQIKEGGHTMFQVISSPNDEPLTEEQCQYFLKWLVRKVS